MSQEAEPRWQIVARWSGERQEDAADALMEALLDADCLDVVVDHGPAEDPAGGAPHTDNVTCGPIDLLNCSYSDTYIPGVVVADPTADFPLRSAARDREDPP